MGRIYYFMGGFDCFIEDSHKILLICICLFCKVKIIDILVKIEVFRNRQKMMFNNRLG